jgi:hypothetical protein
MPNNKEHCEDSLRRYGKTFSELHTWMDEPSAILGANHRKYRHDPHTTPLEAKKLFGENADHACLDHIRLDELESRQKGIGRTLTGRVKQPQPSISFALGFFTLMFFTIALVIVSTPRVGWVSIPFFVFSFFFFLALIGSLTQSKKKDVILEYTVEMPKPIIFEYQKTCSKCGTKYNPELEKCPNCGRTLTA